MPAHLIRVTNGEGQLAMRCKSWRCPDCGPWMKWRLIHALRAATDERPGLRRFFTLTLPGESRGLDLKQRYELLQHAWTKLARRLDYRMPGRFEYVKVIEPHQDGTPHIHGLAARFVPITVLRDLWQQCGGGRMVDIRFVDAHRVSAYLAKYMAKHLGAPPRGMRKYSAGGGVTLEGVRPKGKGDGSWWIVVQTPMPSGRLAWMWVPEPRTLFGQLAARAGLVHGPPDVVARARARAWGIERRPRGPSVLSDFT